MIFGALRPIYGQALCLKTDLLWKFQQDWLDHYKYLLQNAQNVYLNRGTGILHFVQEQGVFVFLNWENKADFLISRYFNELYEF